MHEQISNDLIEVANKFPDLTVSISIKDLMAANRSFINCGEVKAPYGKNGAFFIWLPSLSE